MGNDLSIRDFITIYGDFSYKSYLAFLYYVLNG